MATTRPHAQISTPESSPVCLSRGSIHANDNSGNYDDHKPPGEGNIDWKRLLTELSQIEFHGAFILELSGNKEPEIVLAEARRARHYLRGISRHLALSSPPTVNVANRTA